MPNPQPETTDFISGTPINRQMLAGMSGGEENSRRSSRYNRNASKRMSSLASPRSPASRSSAKITTTGAAAAGGGKTGPLSPSLTMAMTAVQLKPPATVASAVARMGSSIGLAPAQMSRNIRVQPVDADKVYGVSADRKPPDEEVGDDRRNHGLLGRGERGGEGGGTHFVHGRSRMTIDPRFPTMPGRSTSGFHQPGRHCSHQARAEGGGHRGAVDSKNFLSS